MAHVTGTAATLTSFVDQLLTAVTANGWTMFRDDPGNGIVEFNLGRHCISLRWEVATPTSLAIYQSLGFTAGNDPGDHYGDSGGGAVGSTAATLVTGRGIHGLVEPFVAHDIFIGDDYVHVCLEHDAGRFRHFGWGVLKTESDMWEGGEYCYGQVALESGSSPTSTSMSHLLDSCYTTSDRHAATVLGLGITPTANTWWRVCTRTTAGDVGDRNGPGTRARIIGMSRGGLAQRNFMWIPFTPRDGEFFPMATQSVWDIRIDTDMLISPWGHTPDLGMLNIVNVTPGTVVTVGGDRWKMFPAVYKDSASTGNLGVAYRIR